MQNATSLLWAYPGIGASFAGAGAIGGSAFQGRASSTNIYLWGLPRGESATVAASDRPRFEVNYAGIPGVNPDEFEPKIIKLNPTKDNWRLVGISQMKEGLAAGPNTAWPSYTSLLEEIVPSEVQIISPGRSTISTNKSLEPGEYAIVLRPTLKQKQFSAEAVTKNQGEGVLFNSAWSFKVGVETSAPQRTNRLDLAGPVPYHVDKNAANAEAAQVAGGNF
jgi:hypothetical protein